MNNDEKLEISISFSPNLTQFTSLKESSECISLPQNLRQFDGIL